MERESVWFFFHNDVYFVDVKPENILITKQNVVKLCDFGFARLMSKFIAMKSSEKKSSDDWNDLGQQLEMTDYVGELMQSTVALRISVHFNWSFSNKMVPSTRIISWRSTVWYSRWRLGDRMCFLWIVLGKTVSSDRRMEWRIVHSFLFYEQNLAGQIRCRSVIFNSQNSG